ncbi:MAG: hypothetical protein AAGA71_16670 [Pseudomonadota bacterium]
MDLSIPPGEPALDIPAPQLALMVVAGAVAWRVAKMDGLFGATILGPMIAAGLRAIAGILGHRSPA